MPLAPTSGEAPAVTAGAVLEACLAGVCLFAPPFWLFLHSVQLIGSSAAAQFRPAVPILTIVLARLLLRETLTPQQITGGLVTACALLGVAWSTARAAP